MKPRMLLAIALVTAVLSATGHAEATTTFTVNVVTDDSDINLADAICDTDPAAGVQCSLRAAIQEANDTSGFDIINFDIGSGTQTISPASALPTITSPLTIDGTTQPGFAGTPIIELNGTNAGSGTDGLTITGGNSTIRGLVINRFGLGEVGVSDGILIQDNGGNIIEGNYIGTNVAGTAAQGNRGNGVSISSANNRIGGTSSAQRNVISGNNATSDHGGIELDGAGATGNLVQGNYIGTNAAGTAAVPNGGHGVLINGAADNTIGGPTPGAGNIISGNTRPGLILQSANNNVVQSNHIGTDATGAIGIANNGRGVVIDLGSSGNTFGGIGSAANVIAFNTGPGILVLDGTANRLSDNSFYSNTGLAIDLSPLGVTGNDQGDSDTGPNNLQNFPVLISAGFNNDRVWVNGTLNSTAATAFTLTFYHNTSCHPSGHGEGRLYAGSQSVSTDGSGNASFGVLLAPPGVSNDGAFITATATDPAGNTSEFSSCEQVTDDADDDNDGFTDDVESGTPLCSKATNDDGPPVNDDTLVNDGCPAVGPAETACSDNVDNDADGRVNDGCPQVGAFSEAEFNIGTGSQDPCGDTGWPADLFSSGTSANKLDIQDIVAFLSPLRHLDTSPANPNFAPRFDLVPGRGAFGQWVNIQDVTSLLNGPTASPPMLAGVRAFNQTCPWPP